VVILVVAAVVFVAGEISRSIELEFGFGMVRGVS